MIKQFENLKDPLKKVNEELEQLQVNLYNVSQKKTTISGLADDFEDLANKISLTNEEAEKLEEIVNSVNDTAGFKVITASDTQGQLEQIKAYETSLAIEQQGLIEEQNKAIGKGYKDLSKESYIYGNGDILSGTQSQGALAGTGIGAAIGLIFGPIGAIVGAGIGAIAGTIIGIAQGAAQDTEAAQQQYAKEFANSATGKEALNSIGKQQIEGLVKAGQDTQTAVLQMFRDQFGNLLTEDGVDVDKFTKDMGINSDFIAKLDKVLGEESTLVEKWQYINELQKSGMNEDLINSLKSANVELAVMSKVSKQTAEYMSNVEGSSDLISEMWQKASKLLSLAGKSSDEISTLLSGALNKAAQDPKNFKKILVEEMSKIYTNEAVIKMSPEEVAALEEQVKEAYDKVQKAIEERSKIKDTNSDEYKDKTKEITELSAAYNELNEKLDGYKNNTENITDATNDLYSIFDGQALSDWGDAIDKLSSKIERLTKITDISALSGADLVQLIRDYPELTDKIMSGNINLSDLVGMIRSGTKTIIEKAQTSYKDAQDAIDTAAITGKITDKQKAFMLSKDAVQFFNQSDKTERELMSELGLDYLNEEDVKQFNLMRSLVNSLNNAEITVSQTLARLGTEETAIEKLFGESVIGLSARYDAVADNIDKIKNAMTLLDEESDEYLERQKQLIEGYGDEVSLTMDKIKEAEEAALKKVDTPEIWDYVKRGEQGYEIDYEKLKTASQKVKDDVYSAFANTDDTKGVLTTLNETLKEYYSDLTAAAKNAADVYVSILKTETEKINEELEKRKTAYEDYFDAIDDLEDEQDTARDRESIIKQLQALSGGADAASKNKIKELRQELNDLNKEALQTEREKLRDAAIEEIDKQIDKNTQSIDETTQKLYKLMYGQIMSGKKTPDNWFEWLQENAPQYKSGGMVSSTGLAMLHGSKQNPEAVLSAEQTSLIQNFLSALQASQTVSTKGGYSLDGTSSNVVIENLEIRPNQLNNNQDWQEAAGLFAETFNNIIRRGGLNVNVKK